MIVAHYLVVPLIQVFAAAFTDPLCPLLRASGPATPAVMLSMLPALLSIVAGIALLDHLHTLEARPAWLFALMTAGIPVAVISRFARAQK